MSALKTVERASDLKLLEKKLNIIMRDISGFIDRQNDVNRDIRQVECQLSLITNIEKTDNTFGGKTALQSETLEKFTELDKTRDSLIKRRDVLKKQITESGTNQSVGLTNPQPHKKSDTEVFNGVKEAPPERIDRIKVPVETFGGFQKDLPEKLDSIISPADTIILDKKAEVEKLSKEIDLINHEIGGLIKDERINRDKQIEILTQTHENLINKRDTLDGKISESTAKYNEIQDKIAEVKGKGLKKNPLSKGLKVIGGVGAGALVNTVKGGVKSGFNKADPFAKGINKEDTGDTGAESIRLAKTSLSKAKSGIKTAKNTVKTTNRGLKTVKNVTVNTVKATYRTTVKTVKVAYIATKALITGMTHIIAFLMNPVVLILIAVLLVAVMLSQAVVVLMGAVAGGGATATGAVGLGNVPESYNQGLTLLENAIADAQTGFNDLVNAPGYYGGSRYNGDLADSDLIFLRTIGTDGGITNYSTAFATDAQKAMLKNAWSLNLPENEILSIAYVLLQKRANEENNTAGQVYKVDYTFEIFNEIISLIASYRVTIYTNQYCPNQNCTIDVYTIPNPNYINPQQTPNISPTIETESSPYCGGSHTLHAVELRYSTTDTVMTTLGFTDTERQLVGLTITGFENNPNL